MARTGKPKASNKGGKNSDAGTAGTNKTKKNKNLFKVNDSKQKKKPKEVQGKLKKLKEVVNKKKEAIDANLRELHKDLVVKKPKAAAASKPLKGPKKPAVNTKNVADKLGNFKL